jgi:hypothetical protein
MTTISSQISTANKSNGCSPRFNLGRSNETCPELKFAEGCIDPDMEWFGGFDGVMNGGGNAKSGYEADRNGLSPNPCKDF